jgi:hypothetical protein
MKRTSQFLAFAVLVAFFSFIACKKENDKEDDTPSPAARNNISGTVISDNSVPIAGATVSVDGKSTTTDANGKYFIGGLSGSLKYQIAVVADGFFNGYKNVENINDANCEIYADVMLLTKQELPQSIDAQTGGAIASPDNDINYIIAPNAFSLNGVLYDGPVRVRTNYMDALDQGLIGQAMPGGDFAAVDSDGNDGGLISYGFLATEFVTGSGQVLSVNPNTVQAGISVPSQVPNPGANNASAWIFNPTNGNWSSAGDVTNIDDMWFMPVTSQLFCNLDQFSFIKELTGRIVDCNGKGVPIADVTVSSGVVSYSTMTNGDGYYRVKVPVPSSYVIQVNENEATLNTGVLLGEYPIIVDDIQLPCPEDPVQQGTGTANFLGVQYTGVAECDLPDNGLFTSRITTTNGDFFFVRLISSADGTYSLDNIGTPENPNPENPNFLGIFLSPGDAYFVRLGTVTRNGNVIQVTAEIDDPADEFMATLPFTMTINCQ